MFDKDTMSTVYSKVDENQLTLTFIIPNKIRRILLVLLDILWPLRGHKILKVYIYRTEMTHVSFAVR